MCAAIQLKILHLIDKQQQQGIITSRDILLYHMTILKLYGKA